MELLQYRVIHDDRATVSALFRDGRSEGYCLEDAPRPIKIPDRTRIPAGRYQIRARDAGAMVLRYKAKYSWHRGMLHLRDVPGFDWIYYHVGNTDEDTSGCILVGRAALILPGQFAVKSSVAAYEPFYRAVIGAAESGDLWTTIVDRDG